MKKKLIYISACIALLGLGSCDKFLDVHPKSQILADLHFSRESGYFDQLIGVYTKMCEPSMYGREMTFGLMEVLSQNYALGATNVYRDAANYDYMSQRVRSKIDDIWINTYNCIANLNIMLEYIDEADPNIFMDNNQNLYKGEALGLRAFLHLDLLRIFSPSYASNPGALAIPYVTQYEPRITEQKTVSQTLDLIIKDLEDALNLLATADPISNTTGVSFDVRSDRRVYFNYYAALATLARAYLYKGDKVNALKCAEEFIEADAASVNFAIMWTDYTSATSSNSPNRLFTPEHVFQLRINNFADIVDPWVRSIEGASAEANPNGLFPGEVRANIIYELDKGYGNDYRRNYAFQFDGPTQYHTKFWGSNSNQFPLIRKTEFYYIAAEALKDTEPQRAVKMLNIVRGGPSDTTSRWTSFHGRNLANFPLPETLSATEIQEEVFKEYRKEFLAEGQLFFYYKRLNLSTIQWAPVTANDRIYVLPMPDNEVDFGFRQ